MAIRIRFVGGRTLALCAARSVERKGDVYLDDGIHSALAEKFAADFASEGFYSGALPSAAVLDAVEKQESNNSNREEWDRRYSFPEPRLGARDMMSMDES